METNWDNLKQYEGMELQAFQAMVEHDIIEMYDSEDYDNMLVFETYWGQNFTVAYEKNKIIEIEEF